MSGCAQCATPGPTDAGRLHGTSPPQGVGATLLPIAPSYDAWSHPTARLQHGPSPRCCATCDVALHQAVEVGRLSRGALPSRLTLGVTVESNSLRRSPIGTFRLRKVWRCLWNLPQACAIRWLSSVSPLFCECPQMCLPKYLWADVFGRTSNMPPSVSTKHGVS